MRKAKTPVLVSLAVVLGLAQMLQVRKAPPSAPYVNVTEALKGALRPFSTDPRPAPGPASRMVGEGA
jgi:hypothetical protein